MTARVDLRLDGAVDQLRLAWQVGETVLHQVAFAEDATGTRYNILLALQELLTNVLRHGYRRSEAVPIQVRFEVADHAFHFEIRDRAPRFDPTAADTDRDGETMPASEGGYGLLIVRTVLDDIAYRYEDGWNIIRATKYVAAQAAVASPEEPS